MPIRRLHNRHFVGVVIDKGESEESNPFCQKCDKVGIISRLKERLYLYDKGKLLISQPPDSDNWLQCWTCGYIIPTRDAKMIGKISGINGISPVDNPFDFQKGTILGLNDMGKGKRYAKLKQRKNKHPDKEVQKLIDQGWEVKEYKTSIPV